MFHLLGQIDNKMTRTLIPDLPIYEASVVKVFSLHQLLTSSFKAFRFFDGIMNFVKGNMVFSAQENNQQSLILYQLSLVSLKAATNNCLPQ